ncbi:MAG: hypothetical protein JWO82_3949 [Akkermansiaceae bacterium]|nr:hypothetical protein [Akkermansiaceae bacterium]
MIAKNRFLLLLVALFLGSCAPAPQGGPQMKSPDLLHSQVKLHREFRGSPGVPPPLGRMLFFMTAKGQPPREIAFPADAAVTEELLKSSNFELSEGMMLDLADRVFDHLNSPCPDGNHYKRTGDQAAIRTVDSTGTVWQIVVSGSRDGGWKAKIGKKSRDKKYPGQAIAV